MKFLLDTSKYGFLMVAGTVWTGDDPGPKEIDLDQLSKAEVEQLMSNCVRGFLKVEDPDGFLAYAQQDTIAKVVPPPPVIPSPPIPVPLDPEIAPKTNGEKFSSILKQRAASIKKLLPSFSIGQLRKLEELEKKGKSRKGLLKELSAMLAKHSESVSKSIDTSGTGEERFLVGVNGINSPNVSDIVESEVKQIVFSSTEE